MYSPVGQQALQSLMWHILWSLSSISASTQVQSISLAAHASGDLTKDTQLVTELTSFCTRQVPVSPAFLRKGRITSWPASQAVVKEIALQQKPDPAI